MKSAFVAIIGRPSAGKSTLLNSICGEKVSITADVPQTTRNRIRGIITGEEGQLIFLDTPGYHHSDKKFNQYLTDTVKDTINEAEVILYVVDATRPPGKEEEEIMEMIQKSGKSLIIAMNKTDKSMKYLQEIRGIMAVNMKPLALLDVSALEKKGLEELKKALYKAAPEGEQLYPDEFYTDQEPEFRIAEIIREQAITRTTQEVPHALYVEIADMEMKNEGRKLWVRAFLNVETDSQKGILIGKGGQMIKTIRVESLKEFRKIFDYKIELDLRVKVNPKWRKKDPLLKDLLS